MHILTTQQKRKDRENEGGNNGCDSFGVGGGIRAIPVIKK
jgi:hypothetical protein